MPSVGIALFQKCEKKTADIHKAEAIKDVHGSSCDKLDADRLADLGVDDCAGTSSKLTHIVMTFECVDFAMMFGPDVPEACFLPKMGTQLEGCPAAMDKAIDGFEPMPIEELNEHVPEDALDSFEFTLGVFAACSSVVESSAPEMQDLIKGSCSQETDPASMDAMGVTYEDCVETAAKPFDLMTVAACSMSGLMNPQVDHSTATGGTVNEVVEAFVGETEEAGLEAEVEELEHGDTSASEAEVEEAEHGADQQDPAKRLRLYSVVGGEKYFGKSLGKALRKSLRESASPLVLRSLRKSASWSQASAALAVAASASALAALGLLAWRRHLAEGRPEETEPALRAQDALE